MKLTAHSMNNVAGAEGPKGFQPRGHSNLYMTLLCQCARRRWAAVWVLAFLPVVSLGAQSPDAKAYSPEEELGRLRIWANRIAPIALSPSGESIAMVVSDREAADFDASKLNLSDLATSLTTLRRGLDIWTVNAASGALKRLTNGRSSNWSPAWSPTGDRLAFLSDRDGSIGIWIWESQTGRLRRASPLNVSGIGHGTVVEWLADGRHVVVQAPERAAARTTATGASRSARRDAGSEATAHVEVFHNLAVDSAALERSYLLDLALENALKVQEALGIYTIDVTSGQARALVRGIHPLGYWVSPSGKAVAFSTMDTSTIDGVRTCNIGIAEVTGRVRSIAQGVRQSACRSVSWSPRGDKLAYAARDSSGVLEVYVVPAIGGEASRLTDGSHTDLGIPRDEGPQWDAEGDGVYLVTGDTVWHASRAAGMRPIGVHHGRKLLQVIGAAHSSTIWSPDSGRSLYLLTRDDHTMRMGMVKMDIGTGASSVVVESDQRLQPRGGIDCLGNAVVYVAEGATNPPDLWTVRDGVAKPHRLTILNPSLEHRRFGKAQLIEWRGLHGDRLRGVLVLPSEYDSTKRYPLVVSLYGGYRPAAEINRFGLVGTGSVGPLNVQLLATRGYAVLIPDALYRPGGTVMFDLAASALPGVNRVVDLGIADSNRIGVTGLSFGGYTALALATQTPRFKAVVVRAGFSDMNGYSATSLSPADGMTAGFRNAERLYGLGGTVWQRRERYIDNSPYFFLDRVNAPVLIIHGTSDDTVDRALADATYSALRRLGKTVEYARYVGEGHGESIWSYSDSLDEMQRILGWFDRFLQPGPNAQP